VSFDAETPACWNLAGRDELRNTCLSPWRRLKPTRKALDDVLVNEGREEFIFDDPEFVFRWASAGALPIVRLGGEEYFCSSTAKSSQSDGTLPTVRAIRQLSS